MKTDGESFLDELASLPAQSWENRFSKRSRKLGLGIILDRNELKLLYEASCFANACNLALNGMGSGECGMPLPENEGQRIRLERQFMVARDMLFASPGWQLLSDSERKPIARTFLKVSVQEDKMAC